MFRCLSILEHLFLLISLFKLWKFTCLHIWFQDSLYLLINRYFLYGLESLFSLLPSLLSNCRLISLPRLIYILGYILTLQLSHPLYLVEVDYEAFIVRVELFNTLTAEYRHMIWAIEMLYPLWMHITKLLHHTILVFIFKIEVAGGQDRVLLDYFVQNIDV